MVQGTGFIGAPPPQKKNKNIVPNFLRSGNFYLTLCRMCAPPLHSPRLSPTTNFRNMTLNFLHSLRMQRAHYMFLNKYLSTKCIVFIVCLLLLTLMSSNLLSWRRNSKCWRFLKLSNLCLSIICLIYSCSVYFVSFSCYNSAKSVKLCVRTTFSDWF